MGLSASQARLLSITSRISDNELRSQTITTAKTALANKTSQASQEYLAALDETNMFFSTYDADGNKVREKLTAACLSQYAPLKNQYGIINTDGQIMVSEIDAQNYLESATLGEFLEKYGVATVEDVQVDNPEYVEQAIYIYGSNWKEWIEGTAAEDTAGGLQGLKPNEEDYNQLIWTETINAELYPKFVNASKGCLDHCYNKEGSGEDCYLHVLAHLLDLEVDSNGSIITSAYPKTFTTTYGQGISVDSGKITSSNIYGGPWNAQHTKTLEMKEVSEAVCNETGKVYYAAEDEADKAHYESLATSGLTGNDLLVEQLLSNYYTDENGETQLKTLKQKIIDLYYVTENRHSLGVDFDTTLINAIERFQEDMKLKELTPETIPDPEAYEEAYKKWQTAMEQALGVLNGLDRYLTDDQITVTDADEAQWYVNLWHRMNGASDYKAEIEGVENGAHPETHYLGQQEEEEKYAGMENSLINGLTANGKLLWTVLEDGLMNSAEYLNYGLKNGTLTLERVNFSEPTEDGSGIEQATWTAIIYSNALDISEEENEKAITKAEVKYQQAMKDIEAKDKQYDNMIRRLDTEHNALQTEYDSIKNVIGKNIERTLKMYS